MTFALDGGRRNTFLVFRTIRFRTSAWRTPVTGSVETFLTTTLVASVSVSALSVQVTTIRTVTLVYVRTKVSSETVKTVAKVTSFAILTLSVF